MTGSANRPSNGLYKKLYNIMQRVDFIQKDKTNEFHKYNYASEEAIKKTLHTELLKEKILFSISGSNLRTEPRGDSIITHIDFDYRFIDVDSGEILEGTMPGTGEDKGDKGTYKAITGAIKYILTSTFLIPTGDDPENDNGSKTEKKSGSSRRTELNYATGKQRGYIKTLLKDADPADKELQKRLSEIGYNNILEIDVDRLTTVAASNLITVLSQFKKENPGISKSQADDIVRFFEELDFNENKIAFKLGMFGLKDISEIPKLTKAQYEKFRRMLNVELDQKIAAESV